MRRLVEALENALFGHRRIALLTFVLMSGWLGYQTSNLSVDAGFEKHLPLGHPFMRTFLEYQSEFGGANKLLIAVRAKEGDIFTPRFFNALREITDEVFFLPGVNRGTVTSIYTPNVRFIEIVEGGFTGGNVIPADFAPTPDRLAEVRENILKSGTVGRLVADDFTAAMVNAELLEIDPATGHRLDYLEVADKLEREIREKYVDDYIDIHIIGFAAALGQIAGGAKSVFLFFGIAFLITFFLVYRFSRSVILTLLPLLCSILAVVWNLGLLATLGRGMDPMSLLVPFLVFAIGVSHGVQMINLFASELRAGSDSPAAARVSFRRLVMPGGVALVSDTIGFLTLLLIAIGIIRELAVASAMGVLVVMLTNLILLPVLLSYVGIPDEHRSRMAALAKRREVFWRRAAVVAEPRAAAICLVVAFALGVFGFLEGRNVRIGDLHAGVPELRSEARYNRDAAVIVDKFTIGVDIITTIVETVPNGCIEHDVMDAIDRFQWRISNLPGVQSTISLPQIAKIINAGWNEGSLKWRTLPRNSQTMVQAVGSVETGTGLLNTDCSVMPVYIFTEDHKAETIDRVVESVETFAALNASDRHRFRLATGNVGVMAASNEVVERAQFPILMYIYAAVVILCLIAFRSLRATLCIVLPLSLVSLLTYALMSRLEIGLKVATLPVTALGVGIGVDYGIYIFSRLQGALKKGKKLREAYLETLQVTGSAVLLTGLTLAVGTSTWIFSALKFQADMGILLTFMFLGNMFGALVLLPALAGLLLPKEASQSE
jgi:predicted RND superfamily exporter protein